MDKGKSTPRTGKPKHEEETHSFDSDRKGEASAGALSNKDKKRAVAASRDGSNTR